jgi:hypothetical protein
MTPEHTRFGCRGATAGAGHGAPQHAPTAQALKKFWAPHHSQLRRWPGSSYSTACVRCSDSSK